MNPPNLCLLTDQLNIDIFCETSVGVKLISFAGNTLLKSAVVSFKPELIRHAPVTNQDIFADASKSNHLVFLT